MKKTQVDIGNGIRISVESDDPTGIPDTTVNAGPDTIELHEDAQKPADAPAAEYDAEQHVDTPEDVEKANESTFLGLTIRRRSNEGFGLKTKGQYASAADFFKSPECKAAVETAKAWATKKKWVMATIADTKGAKGLTNAGFKFIAAFGATFAYIEAKGKLNINILFKDGKAITQKAFAKITVAAAKKPAGKKKAVESFYDLTLALRASEGFALKRTIDAYRNADEFFKGAEFKGVLSTAKKWADGKNYSSIPTSEAKSVEPSKTAKFLEKGWTLKSIAGNSFLVREKRETKGGIIGKDNLKDHSLDICILFKTDKNKLVIKLFAKLKLAKGGGVGSSESAVLAVLGVESADGIDDTAAAATTVPAGDPNAGTGVDDQGDAAAASIVAAAADEATAGDDTAAAGDGSAAASGVDDAAAAGADTAAGAAQADIDAGAAGDPGASSDDTVTTVEVESADISDVDPDTGAVEGDAGDDTEVIADDAAGNGDGTVIIEEGDDVATDDDDDDIADSTIGTDDAAGAAPAAAGDESGTDDASATTDTADDQEKALESFLAQYGE